MPRKYYIGIATTLHDPALAIVDDKGEILFAEAAERHYQNKRAIGLPPDDVFWVVETILKYCDRNSEFVIAKSWRDNFYNTTKWLSAGNITTLLEKKVLRKWVEKRTIADFESFRWV